jgi:hypothetical protein
LDAQFALPKSSAIDATLVLAAGVFGIDWDSGAGPLHQRAAQQPA